MNWVLQCGGDFYKLDIPRDRPEISTMKTFLALALAITIVAITANFKAPTSTNMKLSDIKTVSSKTWTIAPIIGGCYFVEQVQ
jgi:hypothetical protein